MFNSDLVNLVMVKRLTKYFPEEGDPEEELFYHDNYPRPKKCTGGDV